MTYWVDMLDIVREKVGAYDSDLLVDMLCIGRNGPGLYLWAVRPTGTDMMPYATSTTDDEGHASVWFTISMRHNHWFYMVDTEQHSVEPVSVDDVIACLAGMDDYYLRLTLIHPEFVALHGKHSLPEAAIA